MNLQRNEDQQNFKIVDQKYYLKTKILGCGTYAKTHRATLIADESKEFACKVIGKQDLVQKLNSQSPQHRDYLIQALQTEVQVWKKLDHQNIVRFIEFSETSNNIYLFLEYCNSGDLNQYIKKYGRLPENNALFLFSQILSGCKYLYDQNIIHRDLKPANILLHNNVAKIADFGFSKYVQENQKDDQQQRSVVGTPYYMAPQISLRKGYSIKSDIWSLGIMLYEFLYGVLPWYENGTEKDLVKIILNTPLTFPSNDSVSEEVKTLITKMLQLKEEERISINELCQEVLSLIKKRYPK